MSQHETKTIRAEIKQAGEAGAFEAVIATLGVIDSDGDIMEPGSFAGKTLHVIPSHDGWQAPMGKVELREEGNEAIASGRFNLEVSHGRDWYEAVKFDAAHPPSLQEWSFDLSNIKGEDDTVEGQNVRRILAFDSKEISPVLRGAGINTRTLAVKSLDAHKTETSGAPWDEVANGRFVDANGTRADAGPLLHHFMSKEGVGAASTRACVIGIARLNGAMPALSLGSEDRRKLYDHLSAHLKDAGVAPPGLLPAGCPPSMRLSDRVLFATWEMETAIEHIRSASSARKGQGRQLSEGVRAEAIGMATAFAEMQSAAKKLDALVESCSDDDPVALATAAWAVTRARGVV